MLQNYLEGFLKQSLGTFGFCFVRMGLKSTIETPLGWGALLTKGHPLRTHSALALLGCRGLLGKPHTGIISGNLANAWLPRQHRS